MPTRATRRARRRPQRAPPPGQAPDATTARRPRSAAAGSSLRLARQNELEAAALAGRRPKLDPAAERERELARDREPEPRPAAIPRPERTEDPVALLRRDPRTAVVDGHADRPVRRPQLERDPASVGRPAEGIR